MTEIERLDTMSRNALETLQRVFPYAGRAVQERDVSLLVLHGKASLHDTLGGKLRNRGAHPDHLHLRDGDPDENGRQDPARKTNNQASFGGSILKNNMEAEAAMELQRHLDETGVHQVHTIYA